MGQLEQLDEQPQESWLELHECRCKFGQTASASTYAAEALQRAVLLAGALANSDWHSSEQPYLGIGTQARKLCPAASVTDLSDS